MKFRGAQLNTGTVSGYVSANPDEVKEFVESFPQDQQVARYMHIWRLVGANATPAPPRPRVPPSRPASRRASSRAATRAFTVRSRSSASRPATTV
jgi:hypothetical protein